MRRTVEIADLIDDLNELAKASAEAMNDGVSVGGMDADFLSRIAGIAAAIPAETTEAEAAELLRTYFDALEAIADGAPDPVAIAEAALAIEPEAATILNGRKIGGPD